MQMPWLQLIRWQNLLIILITQLLAWWCVILPLSPQVLTPVNFSCLALSTALIAAAGYIINDYFDVKIDSINRPERVVLAKAIPRKQAIVSHIALNVAAVILAGFVAAAAHHLSLLLIQLGSILLLWFYSTHFKRMFMIGNVVVALLTALTVATLIFYEPAVLRHCQYPAMEETSLDYLDVNPFWLLMVYSLFAFMLNWMREIVKDLEDLKGDAEEGCDTMPVKWGISRTLGFVRVLGGITLVYLLFCELELFSSGNKLLDLYILLLVVAPIVVWLIGLGKKLTTIHFHRSSTQLKLMMLSGVLSLIVYYCIIWIRSY